ncbi:MAG TPA: hypothetical protein VFL34_16235 [Candidatus Sulfotelmatobacter sp.]|nr:hypothetical protein [Candidatus Sulfotelmatobacter sp.]
MAQMVERLNTSEEFTIPVEKAKLRRAGEAVGLAIGKSVAKTRQLGRQLRDRAEFVKQEKPLQLLGVVTGLAMAAGIATRVWRSNRDA